MVHSVHFQLSETHVYHFESYSLSCNIIRKSMFFVDDCVCTHKTTNHRFCKQQLLGWFQTKRLELLENPQKIPSFQLFHFAG